MRPRTPGDESFAGEHPGQGAFEHVQRERPDDEAYQGEGHLPRFPVDVEFRALVHSVDLPGITFGPQSYAGERPTGLAAGHGVDADPPTIQHVARRLLDLQDTGMASHSQPENGESVTLERIRASQGRLTACCTMGTGCRRS